MTANVALATTDYTLHYNKCILFLGSDIYKKFYREYINKEVSVPSAIDDSKQEQGQGKTKETTTKVVSVIKELEIVVVDTQKDVDKITGAVTGGETDKEEEEDEEEDE